MAIFARLGFLAAIVAISVCAFTPKGFLPRFIYSYHVEHFAAFYVLSTAAAAAAPRRGVTRLARALIGFALLIEVARLLPPAHRLDTVDNLAADVGGVLAALSTVAVGGFRQAFARSPSP